MKELEPNQCRNWDRTNATESQRSSTAAHSDEKLKLGTATSDIPILHLCLQLNCNPGIPGYPGIDFFNPGIPELANPGILTSLVIILDGI